MSNQCEAYIETEGSKESIQKFIGLFQCLYSDDDPDSKEVYFARSYLIDPQKDILSRLESKSTESNTDKIKFSFNAYFDWSADVCIISIYPYEREKAISLQEACIKCGVSVLIQTTEPGVGFDEEIRCDADGGWNYESFDLEKYQCNECSTINDVSRFSLIENVSCYECHSEGDFTPIDDETQED